MNEIASRELCAELYELSGWNDTKFSWFDGMGGWRFDHDETEPSMYEGEEVGTWLPAYSLGFLQRKLRDYAEDYNGEGMDYSLTSHHPEDDLATLAIELFKQGILTNTPKAKEVK